MRATGQQQWAEVKYSQTALGASYSQGQVVPGGLDLVTPSLRLFPGALSECQNFYVAPTGGYTRVEGYERFDGRLSPSAATYTVVQMASTTADDFTGDFNGSFGSLPGFLVTPTVGTSVVQALSGATGTIIAVVTAPVAYIVLTRVTGVFTAPGVIKTAAGVALGYATSLTVVLTQQLKAIYAAAAADVYRALIGMVPGIGSVLGVVAMQFAGADHVYAWRAAQGNVDALLYRATTAGWVLVPYYNLVSFTAGGTTVPLDGATLTQGGKTATIKRVMWQSGSWTGSTAVGQFVVTNPAGGNFASGAATVSGGATVTLSAAQTPIRMMTGGRFEFEKANFAGQLVTRRIYGCDGINPAFEFDGETLSPIKTGAVPDMPSHIRFHKNYLFLSQDASLLYSAPGAPFMWSAVDGAGEIATGDTVTGMITLPGSQTTATLGVFLRNSTAFLYGTDPTSFNYVTFADPVGAVPYSIQNLFDTFFLADLGVVTLKTTQNYGNFAPTSLTRNILPFIARERGGLVASTVNRERGQYRLFFRDGYALYCTVSNQQYLGAAPQLYPDAFTGGVDTTKLSNNDEATYAGGALGYVYQLDVGTSFDGAVIDAWFVTAWDALRGPRILKRFRAASLEMQGEAYALLRYGYQLGYNSSQIAQVPAVNATLNLAGAPRWDTFQWDNFVWDGAGISPTDVDQTGTAENIRVSVTSGTNYIASYTVNSIIHHFSPRRGMRV